MEALFDHLSYWHWWILAVLLVTAEIMVPGIFFLWLGIAAAVTGVAALVMPGLDWEVQLLLFAALSVISAVIGRRVYKRSPPATDHPTLNRRGEQQIGKVFVLDNPIVGGSARLRVGDTTWKVVGSDAAAGTRVRVVGVDGVVLWVEPVDGAGRPAGEERGTGG